MKTISLSILLILGSIRFVLAQTPSSEFVFIENAQDTQSLKAVQRYNVVLKPKDNLEKTYNILKKKAQEKGANCFFLRQFYYDSSKHELTISINTYLAEQSSLRQFLQAYPQNVLYVMTDANFDHKIYTFNVNKEEKTVMSGRFYKKELTSGTQTKLNKGGLTGVTFKVNCEENSLPQFFSLSRFGMDGAGAAPNPAAGGIGLSGGVMFSSGSIFEMDMGFGLLLTHILSEELPGVAK